MFHRSFGFRPTYVTQSWHQVVWYCAFAVGGESSCTSCRAFKDTSWTIWWGSSPKRELFPKGKGRELHLLFSRVVTCSGLINQKHLTVKIMGWVIVVTLPRTSSLWTTQGLLFCPFFHPGTSTCIEYVDSLDVHGMTKFRIEAHLSRFEGCGLFVKCS